MGNTMVLIIIQISMECVRGGVTLVGVSISEWIRPPSPAKFPSENTYSIHLPNTCIPFLNVHEFDAKVSWSTCHNPQPPKSLWTIRLGLWAWPWRIILIMLAEEGRHTHSPWVIPLPRKGILNYVQEMPSGWLAHMHLLSVFLTEHVTSSFKFGLLWPPWTDRPYPGTRSTINPFSLSCFCLRILS